MNSLIENHEINDKLPVPPEPPAEEVITARWQGDPSVPEVSFICHTFNHLDYLKDALNGFLMQETSVRFEIIVHDDASTDGTTDIIKSYSKRYPNIIKPILQTENQWDKGILPGRFSFPAAKGRYIAVCEGDDYWLDPTKIQKQYEHAERKPDTVMFYHHAVVVDDDRRYISNNVASEKGYDAASLATGPFVPTLTRFWRNKPLEWMTRKDLPIGGDLVTTSYLSRYGGAGFTPGILPAVYRRHEGGVWSMKAELAKERITVDICMFLAGRHCEEGREELEKFFLKRAASRILLRLNYLEVFILMRSRIFSAPWRRLLRLVGRSEVV